MSRPAGNQRGNILVSALILFASIGASAGLVEVAPDVQQAFFAAAGTPSPSPRPNSAPGQCQKNYDSCMQRAKTQQERNKCEQDWKQCVSKKCVKKGSGNAKQCPKDQDCETSCTEFATSKDGLQECCQGGPKHRNSCPKKVDKTCNPKQTKGGENSGGGSPPGMPQPPGGGGGGEKPPEENKPPVCGNFTKGQPLCEGPADWQKQGMPNDKYINDAFDNKNTQPGQYYDQTNPSTGNPLTTIEDAAGDEKIPAGGFGEKIVTALDQGQIEPGQIADRRDLEAPTTFAERFNAVDPYADYQSNTFGISRLSSEAGYFDLPSTPADNEFVSIVETPTNALDSSVNDITGRTFGGVTDSDVAMELDNPTGDDRYLGAPDPKSPDYAAWSASVPPSSDLTADEGSWANPNDTGWWKTAGSPPSAPNDYDLAMEPNEPTGGDPNWWKTASSPPTAPNDSDLAMETSKPGGDADWWKTASIPPTTPNDADLAMDLRPRGTDDPDSSGLNTVPDKPTDSDLNMNDPSKKNQPPPSNEPPNNRPPAPSTQKPADCAGSSRGDCFDKPPTDSRVDPRTGKAPLPPKDPRKQETPPPGPGKEEKPGGGGEKPPGGGGPPPMPQPPGGGEKKGGGQPQPQPNPNPNQNQNCPIYMSLLGGCSNTAQCTITVSPTTVQAGNPATLSWQSPPNSVSATIANIGTVPPSGSQVIYPQASTNYSMTVAVNSQYNGSQAVTNSYNYVYCNTSVTVTPKTQNTPYGTGTNGQPCAQPPTQPPAGSCSVGAWQPQYSNGCLAGWQCVQNTGCPNQPPQPESSSCQNDTWKPQYSTTNAACIVGWKCGATTTPPVATTTPPTARISCQPEMLDVGMTLAISFACTDSTGSTGTGFSTNGELSGSTTTIISALPAGSNTATYGITCASGSVTAGAQCSVQVARPSIILVANPKKVKSGSAATLGWVTSGMSSCTISSPELPFFTEANKDNMSVNGMASTSPLTATANFLLSCTTAAGGSRSATTSITVEP